MNSTPITAPGPGEYPAGWHPAHFCDEDAIVRAAREHVGTTEWRNAQSFVAGAEWAISQPHLKRSAASAKGSQLGTAVPEHTHNWSPEYEEDDSWWGCACGAESDDPVPPTSILT